jgi:hypothetical protein
MDHATLEQIYQAQTERELAKLRFQQQQDQETHRRKIYVLSWLSTTDVCRYQEQGNDVRQANPSSGRWILGKDTFRSWIEPFTVEPLLWIHGPPGVGESSH